MTFDDVEKQLNRFKGRMINSIGFNQNGFIIRSGRIEYNTQNQPKKTMSFTFGSSIQKQIGKVYKNVSEFINDSDITLKQYRESTGTDLQIDKLIKCKCLGVKRTYSSKDTMTYIMEFENPKEDQTNPFIMLTAKLITRTRLRKVVNGT